MAKDATLHVKLDTALADGLKTLAAQRGVSVATLVRQALVATYQPQLLDLSQRQRQAVEAYQGGFISLGRLAEALGLQVLEARAWLSEHQIPQNTGFLQDELAEA
jgi:predicted HTH domain antitoxin